MGERTPANLEARRFGAAPQSLIDELLRSCSYSRRQRVRAALAERSMNFLPYSYWAAKIGASGVSLAHLVADSWKSIAWLATFSVVSMYQAANFFAPSTLISFAPRLATFSNTPDALSFSAIFFSPPDFWCEVFAPFGLRELLLMDSPFA